MQLLTHNFLPFALSFSFAFGSTLASFAFKSVSLLIGGLALLEAFDFLAPNRSFKDTDKNDIHKKDTNKHHSSPEPGGRDPQNNTSNLHVLYTQRKNNIIHKKDFFQSVKDAYEYWKNGIYKKKPYVEGLADGKAQFLKWDHLHNDVETYSSSQRHIGSIDPKSLKLYKGPVKTYKIV